MKKEAYFRMMGISKKAGVGGELASAALSPLIPIVGKYTGLPGAAAKVIGDTSSTEEYDKDPTSGYFPFVSSYRLQRRRNEIPTVIGAKNKNKTRHQFFGGLLGNLAGAATGGIIGGLAGAGTGYAVGDGEGAAMGALPGIALGSIIGISAPNLIGGLAALIKRKRTLEEQKAYEEGSALSNYIPGVAAYNQFKNYGVLLGDEYKKAREQHYKKNKKNKKENKQEA